MAFMTRQCPLLRVTRGKVLVSQVSVRQGFVTAADGDKDCSAGVFTQMERDIFVEMGTLLAHEPTKQHGKLNSAF